MPGCKFVHATAEPSVFALRFVAKALFLPLAEVHYDFNLNDLDRLNDLRLDLSAYPLHVPQQCIVNGDLDRARDELDAFLKRMGFLVMMHRVSRA